MTERPNFPRTMTVHVETIIIIHFICLTQSKVKPKSWSKSKGTITKVIYLKEVDNIHIQKQLIFCKFM